MNTRDKINAGIYGITNKINNKIYIGSTFRFKERWRSHKTLLNRDKHFNSHLQASWNKYGEENFEFSIIENIDISNLSNPEDSLIKREEYYILLYNTINNKIGYNTRLDCTSNFGIKWSDSAKEKLSKAKKGKYSELQKAARRSEGEKRRGISNIAASVWWKNLSVEDKHIEVEKRSFGLKRSYQKRKEETGRAVSEETLNKVKQTNLRRGNIKYVSIFNLDGTFIKCFIGYSEALRYCEENEKNSASINGAIKGGLLFHNYLWKVTTEIVNTNMSLEEHNEYWDKVIANTLNYKYKRVSLDLKEITIYSTKSECANSVNVSKPNKQFNTAINNNIVYRGYYWYMIEPTCSDICSKLDEIEGSLEAGNHDGSAGSE